MASAGAILGMVILYAIGYVYICLSMMVIANKTNTPNAWLAWIPIIQVILMIQIARKPIWWIVLLLIPVVNFVIGVIVWMGIAEQRRKPSWVGVLVIVPVVNFFIPGYLAFSK